MYGDNIEQVLAVDEGALDVHEVLGRGHHFFSEAKCARGTHGGYKVDRATRLNKALIASIAFAKEDVNLEAGDKPRAGEDRSGRQIAR